MPETSSIIRDYFFPENNSEAFTAIEPVFERLGIDEAGAQYHYHRHQHQNYEVILIEKGEYVCLLNESSIKLQPNHLLIVKPGDWHQDFCTPPLRYLSLTFHLKHRWKNDIAMSLFRENIETEEQYFKVDDSDFLSLLNNAIKESESGELGASYISQALMVNFFWKMVRLIPEDILSTDFLADSRESGFKTAVYRLFEKNICQRLNVREMAKHLAISESLFCQLCRNYFNNTPGRLLNEYKVGQAIKMLKGTTMSIKEISAYLGFSNQYHFSRVFKEFTGKPPSQLKNEIDISKK
jgi:AraC-like DNA-binding protein